MSFLDCSGLMVSSGIPRRHLGSSSEDDLLLHLPIGLSKAGGKDLLDRLCSSL